MNSSADSPPVGTLPSRAGLSAARRRLFESALALFGEQGYDAVSVRDLMNRMGLQGAALYSHVPGKQQLLFELILIGHEEHLAWLKAALLDSSSDPADQVRRLTRAHVLFHCHYASLARVAHREYRALNEQQQATVLAVRSSSELLFLDVVARGVQMSAFRADTDLFLAIAAIGAMGIRAAEWWTDASAKPAEQVADQYAEYAIRILT